MEVDEELMNEVVEGETVVEVSVDVKDMEVLMLEFKVKLTGPVVVYTEG